MANCRDRFDGAAGDGRCGLGDVHGTFGATYLVQEEDRLRRVRRWPTKAPIPESQQAPTLAM